MTFYKEIKTQVVVSAQARDDQFVDLNAEVFSYDEAVGKFIFELSPQDGKELDLTDAVVKAVLKYWSDGEFKYIHDIGVVDDVKTNQISYEVPERLRGYSGTVYGGITVLLATGQQLDIQNFKFESKRSLIDNGSYIEAEGNYYQSFEDSETRVKTSANKAESSIQDVINDVTAVADSEIGKIKLVLPAVEKEIENTQQEVVEIKKAYETLDLAKKVDRDGPGQVTAVMLSQEVKEAMTGGALPVVGETSVDTANIVDGAVTDSKLAEKYAKILPMDNYFNKEEARDGVIRWYSDGNIRQISNYCGGNLVKLPPKGTRMVKSSGDQFCYLKKNENRQFDYVSGSTGASRFTVPEDDLFGSFAVPLSQKDTYMVCEGTSLPSVYVGYNETINYDIMPSEVKEIVNPTKYPIDIQLPKTMYLTTGNEFNIYWRNVMKNWDTFILNKWDIKVLEGNSNIGNHYDVKWSHTPSVAGTKTIRIRILEPSFDEVIYDKNFTLVVRPANVSANISKTIVTIGDSFTDYTNLASRIYELLAVDSKKTLKFIGLNSSDLAAVKHDAFSGRDTAWYYSSQTYDMLRSDRPLEDAIWDSGWGKGEANGWTEGQTYKDLTVEQRKHGKTINQFYNPETKKFDFSYYMNKYFPNEKVDCFLMLLGINDSVWWKPNDLRVNTSFKRNLDHIFNSVHDYDATIKILVHTIPPQGVNDSYMGSYGWVTSRRAKYAQEFWNGFILSTYDTDDWLAKNVHVMASSASFDYRYGIITKKIKPVKFSTMEIDAPNEVHPNTLGATQIGDPIADSIRGLIFN